jgi:hypothetical protein
MLTPHVHFPEGLLRRPLPDNDINIAQSFTYFLGQLVKRFGDYFLEPLSIWLHSDYLTYCREDTDSAIGSSGAFIGDKVFDCRPWEVSTACGAFPLFSGRLDRNPLFPAKALKNFLVPRLLAKNGNDQT